MTNEHLQKVEQAKKDIPDKEDQLDGEIDLIEVVKEATNAPNIMNFPDISPVAKKWSVLVAHRGKGTAINS